MYCPLRISLAICHHFVRDSTGSVGAPRVYSANPSSDASHVYFVGPCSGESGRATVVDILSVLTPELQALLVDILLIIASELRVDIRHNRVFQVIA